MYNYGIIVYQILEMEAQALKEKDIDIRKTYQDPRIESTALSSVE